ncbi:hypothetical protein SVIO_027450 [Streptomyces violaceusniger]|uniref:DUF4158 domain-containing protein n=1 Tax=Streptomyces violaceusniger TaxID=68280 RepID=A0A4D4KTV0_STRVO|nr:hypothetical protein SVIO_027450 [Streptomyces violaceusniger]
MALFNHAVTWLRENRVLLPGVSVLARQVSEARTAAERRLYEAAARAAHRADPALAPALAELQVRPEPAVARGPLGAQGLSPARLPGTAPLVDGLLAHP